MQGAPLTSRLKACLRVKEWQWWQLPPLMRCYVALPPVLAASIIGYTAAFTTWRLSDLEKFLLLMACVVISVASTPRILYGPGQQTRDLARVWILPTAIILPP